MQNFLILQELKTEFLKFRISYKEFLIKKKLSVLCRGFFEKWGGGVWQILTSSGGSLNADSC